ncbi:MAG: oligosaccharide flippase family protein [Maritimibacter sp.]|nr:oligosaccharide flippase family protein [Maritimibacter sp.]
MLRKLTEPYVVGMASRILGQVISFVSVMVASRYLDLEIFGTYALAWAAAVIGNTFIFTGFYQALLRAGDGEQARDTLFWLNAGLGALFGLAILGAGLAVGGTADPRGLALIALAPIPFFIAPQAWWEALLVRERRVRAASLYVLAAEVCALVTAVVLLAQGWAVGALVASRYVAVAVGLAATGGLVRKLPRLRLSRAVTRDAARTAVPLWGTTGVHLFQNYGTDLILGAFANPAVVGAYRGGARIAITATDLVLQPLGVLTWSRFTRIEKEAEGLAALRHAWIANMGLAAALLWPLSATVALLAEPLVVTVLDETWLPAAGVVVILSLSRAILFFTALLEPTLTITGYASRQFVIRMFGAGSLLLLLMAFARHGAEAASWAHLASSVLVAGVAIWAMLRALELPLAQFVHTFVPGAALTGVTAGIVAATEPLRGATGPGLGLGLSLAAIALAWVVMMGVFLKRRMLELPTP